MPRLAIIMPVYNEQGTLERAIARMLTAAIQMDISIVAVDDGSTDSSPALLAQFASNDPRITVIRHASNRGKGAAIRTAIAELDGGGGGGADFAVIHDADLEYDPADYPRLLAPIIDGRADVVFGSRFMGGEPHRVLYFWHSLGNRALTLLSNAMTNLNLTDMECCFKAFRVDALKRLDLRENRFGIEPELVARVAKAKLRAFEVGVSYAGRTYAEGKKIRWTDGLDAIRAIVVANFRS